MSSLDEGNSNQRMGWIGISYISIASLFCILPMLLDLFIGFFTRNFRFPSKYFTLNPVSIIAISVLMILPMNFPTAVPNWDDQVARLGSTAFISTMIANMLPSLGYLDNKRLVVYVTLLSIPIITVIVTSCMELYNGVIHHVSLACIQVVMLVILLAILINAAKVKIRLQV